VRLITRKYLRHAEARLLNVGGLRYNSRYQQTKGKTMSQFANWVSYPFTVDGVEFVSLVNPNGAMYSKIKNVPATIFTAMNEGAIRELIGAVSKMAKSEIQDELDRVNAGYTEAYLALA
jgi:hypothetical protein